MYIEKIDFTTRLNLEQVTALKDHMFDNQRDLVKSRLTQIHEDFLNNKFDSTHTSIVVAVGLDVNLHDPSTNLLDIITHHGVVLDGQHRINWMVEYGDKFPNIFNLNFVVSVRQFATQQDIEEQYTILDKGRTRNLNDRLKAKGVDNLGFDRDELRWAKVAVNGIIRNLNFKTTRLEKNEDVILPALQNYQEEIREYFDIIDPIAHREWQNFMHRSIMSSPAIHTLKYQPDLAKDFWACLGIQGRPSTTGRDTNLTDTIRKEIIKIGKVNKIQTAVKAKDLHVAALYIEFAWNAWFNNEHDKNVRLKGKEKVRSIVLAGTEDISKGSDNNLSGNPLFVMDKAA